MKKYLITVLLAVLALASCTQRESYNPLTTVIEASFEQDATTTKLSVSDDNGLTWSEGDAFMMFGEGTSSKFTLTGEAGKATATFSGVAPTGIKGAAFPWQQDAKPTLSEGVLSMTLSSELDQTTAGKCNLPMYAAISSGKSISFTHLAGVMRIRFSDIPTGYKTLTVTASKPMSGLFTANIADENPTLTSSSNDDESKVVSVTFTEATDEENSNVLYIPLPVGLYEYIDVEISNGTDTKELISYTNKTVERAKIYTANLSYVDVEASTPVAEGVTINSEGIYYISNVAGLEWFRDQVNNENTFEGKTIKLVADLDLNNENWTSIGTEAKPFSGTFDGNGKTIKNRPL